MTWASLFDRAESSDVSLDAVRDALADRRTGDDDG